MSSLGPLSPTSEVLFFTARAPFRRQPGSFSLATIFTEAFRQKIGGNADKYGYLRERGGAVVANPPHTVAGFRRGREPGRGEDGGGKGREGTGNAPFVFPAAGSYLNFLPPPRVERREQNRRHVIAAPK